ncbi:hypothetical protein U3516DRAFT_756614 [Neocallimastix sp. 'constans']
MSIEAIGPLLYSSLLPLVLKKRIQENKKIIYFNSRTFSLSSIIIVSINARWYIRLSHL